VYRIVNLQLNNDRIHVCSLKLYLEGYQEMCLICTTGVTSGAGTAYPSGASKFTPGV
jgi:hypothetical protein